MDNFKIYCWAICEDSWIGMSIHFCERNDVVNLNTLGFFFDNDIITQDESMLDQALTKMSWFLEMISKICIDSFMFFLAGSLHHQWKE